MWSNYQVYIYILRNRMPTIFLYLYHHHRHVNQKKTQIYPIYLLHKRDDVTSLDQPLLSDVWIGVDSCD